MLEGIDWKLIALLIPITMALTEWVKNLFNNKLGQWAMLVSMILGFITVLFFALDVKTFNWQIFAKMGVLTGLGACGLYNTTIQIGGIKVGTTPTPN